MPTLAPLYVSLHYTHTLSWLHHSLSNLRHTSLHHFTTTPSSRVHRSWTNLTRISCQPFVSPPNFPKTQTNPSNKCLNTLSMHWLLLDTVRWHCDTQFVHKELHWMFSVQKAASHRRSNAFNALYSVLIISSSALPTAAPLTCDHPMPRRETYCHPILVQIDDHLMDSVYLVCVCSLCCLSSRLKMSCILCQAYVFRSVGE